MDLSIIIPIFNTRADILNRCINSICKLKKIKYEIILVDDGSLEYNSIKYKKISNKNDKIRYLKKENSGVSSSRNLGLKEANGKYVMFVDSDDVIFSENFDYDLLCHNYDTIYFNYLTIYDNGRVRENLDVKSYNDGIVDTLEVIKKFVKYDMYYAPWNKIFRKKFLISNNIWFNVNMVNGEDAIFNLNVLRNEPKIYFYDKFVYGYYYTTSNYEKRVKNKFDNVINDYLYKYTMIVDTIEKYNIEKSVLKNKKNDAVETCFRISMICCKYKMNKKIEISEYMNNFKINENELSFKNRLKFALLKNKIWFVVYIFSIIRNIYLKIKGDNYNEN